MIDSIGFDLVFPPAQLKSALVVSLLSVWVLVSVFYYLNRFTHRRYFAIWNVAWLFYALWLTLSFRFPWDTTSPWINMVKHWCIGIAAVFLLWGSADLLGHKHRERQMGLFMAFLLVWSYAGAHFLQNLWAIQLPLFILIGASSVATGLGFARFRQGPRLLGSGLLSVGFLLWGAFLITYPWWQTSEHLMSASYFVAAVLQLFIAVSMIVMVLEEARRSLQRAEKLSALGQMIAGIAHELNNPLAVIQGYLELILKRHEMSPQTRADLEKVVHEGHRAAKLVAQFLSFAREQPCQPKQVDLNALVRQVVELRDLDFARARVEVDLELDPELPLALADSEQIQQVLVNLIQNSVQAMEPKTRPARLKLSSCRGCLGVRILVEDSGPGVPASLAASIYDPFFTTKEVGKGTGLGLAIAHSIMAAHQGKIAYQPSALGGAGFTLDLPVWTVAPPPQGTDSLVVAAEPESQPVAASILVLDDEPVLGELIAEMLRCLGHVPTIYTRPEAALEALGQRPFDLILSDFRMPFMTGQQFYWAVKRQYAEMASRIVFLSGDIVNEEIRAFLNSIGAAFIPKPFRLATVENTVSEHLARFGVRSTRETDLTALPAAAELIRPAEAPHAWNDFPRKESEGLCLQP